MLPLALVAGELVAVTSGLGVSDDELHRSVWSSAVSMAVGGGDDVVVAGKFRTVKCFAYACLHSH